MSAVVKNKRSKHGSLSASLSWLVVGSAALFFLVIYGQQLLLEHSLKDQIAAQRAENAEMENSNTRLKAALLYYQSDKYIEQRAREDLNLRRPDEHVLIPVNVTTDQASETPSQPTPSPDEAAEASSPPAAKANWQKWLELFLPPPHAP